MARVGVAPPMRVLHSSGPAGAAFKPGTPIGRKTREHVQVVDLYMFFIAQFFINLLQARRGATLRGSGCGLPTKLSTVFVGERNEGKRAR